LGKGLFEALTPLLLAVVLGAWLVRWRGDEPWGPSVPPGDLLALLPRWWNRIEPCRPPRREAARRRQRVSQRVARVSGGVRRAEAHLASWGGLGLALAAVLLLLAATVVVAG
jgi:hypothetical protein